MSLCPASIALSDFYVFPYCIIFPFHLGVDGIRIYNQHESLCRNLAKLCLDFSVAAVWALRKVAAAGFKEPIECFDELV